MILIESVKVVDTERDDVVELMHYDMPRILNVSVEKAQDLITEQDLGYMLENVYGRSFVNARGEKVLLGWSKQVEEAIGLPMEVFQKQEEQINYLTERNRYLHEICIRLETQSIWQFIISKFKKDK